MNQTRTAIRYAISFAFSFIVSMTFAACGDDNDSSSEGTEPAASTGEAATVCINKYITVSVVDDEVNGFREAVEDALPGTKFEVQSAEGDAGANQTISAQFARGGCDLIVAATTPGAQAALAATSDIPIVFLGVSNPVQAGLVETLDRPGGNVTGASDPLPVEAELDAMLEALPDATTVGLIWTSGDEAGELHTKRARDHIQELGLKVREAPLTSSGDASQAAQSIAKDVDLIQLPCDATTLAAVPAIVAAATDAGVPVVGCSSEAVDGGAILSGAYDYVELGRLAGEIAVRILQGESPAEIAVVVPPVTGFDVNVTKAKELGIVLPETLVAEAVRKI